MTKRSTRTRRKNAGAWCLYILRCSDDSLYTGVTTDLPRRTKQHNAGTASRYTRTRLPVRVEYHETHATHGSALKREWQVKAMRRFEKEALLRRGRKPNRNGHAAMGARGA